MSVDDSIKSKSICPARCEVQNIDLTVRSWGLPNPAQQDFLTVGLLQIWHDILHDILHLQDSSILQTHSPLLLLTNLLNEANLQTRKASFLWKALSQALTLYMKGRNRSLQAIFILNWLQVPIKHHVINDKLQPFPAPQCHQHTQGGIIFLTALHWGAISKPTPNIQLCKGFWPEQDNCSANTGSVLFDVLCTSIRWTPSKWIQWSSQVCG